MDLSEGFALRPPAVVIRVVALSQQCSVLVVIHTLVKETPVFPRVRSEDCLKSVLVETEVVYSFTLLFELKLVPNFCCTVYFNATLTNVPLTLDHVMPFFNPVLLLTLFKQYNLLSCLFFSCLFLISQHLFPLSFSLLSFKHAKPLDKYFRLTDTHSFNLLSVKII